MPRRSARQKILVELRECMRVAPLFLAAIESSSDDESEDDADLSDMDSEGGNVSSELEEGNDYWSDLLQSSDSEGEQVLQIIASTYTVAINSRYVVERHKVPKATDFRYTYFNDLPDDDFRVITRLSKHVFELVVSLISENPIFQNASPFQQAPVHWQLACTLDRLGNDGQGVSLARSKLIWGLGHGTVMLYYQRVITALYSLRTTFITWPNAAERQQIPAHMETLGFKHCVGFVDGTTLPLSVKPTWHGNNFFDRKKRYSVNAQIVCDHRQQIRHLITGNTGAAHDSGVFCNSPLVEGAQYFFSPHQFLLSDSAYKASPYLVPAYRSRSRDDPHDPFDQIEIERFNTYLAQARVVNEHTIGVLKARWSSLRGLRLDLREEEDMNKIIHHVVVCVILHNIALERDPWQEDIMQVDEDAAEDHDIEPPRRHARRNPGQLKRLQVRRACLAFFDSQNNE